MEQPRNSTNPKIATNLEGFLICLSLPDMLITGSDPRRVGRVVISSSGGLMRSNPKKAWLESRRAINENRGWLPVQRRSLHHPATFLVHRRSTPPVFLQSHVLLHGNRLGQHRRIPSTGRKRRTRPGAAQRPRP